MANPITDLLYLRSYNKFVFLLLFLFKSILNQNQLIIVSEGKLKYLNFQTFSNGDMIFETYKNNAYPNKRIFYALRKNGRYYFKNSKNLEETPFYSIDTNQYDEFENEIGNSIYIDSGIEYYLTIGKYITIFDFNNNNYISTDSRLLLGDNNNNYKANLILIDDRYNYNYYIFSIGFNSTLIKFQLKKNYYITVSNELKVKIETITNKYEIMNCFIDKEKNIIFCLYDYDYKFDYSKNKYLTYYKIDAFSKDLNKLNSISYSFNSYADSSFAGSIPFSKGGGVFAYYIEVSNDFYPNIIFKKYDSLSNNFKNCFWAFNKITLDKYKFNKDKYYNDIIQINDDKLGFFAMSNNLETLYIVIIKFFENYNKQEYKVKYYNMKIYDLFNKIKFQNIKSHIFNNFIIIASNNYNSNENKYFTSLLFLGYPNSTDFELNIIDYLIENNEFTIEKINIDLSQNLIIENNIFEYIYDGITIQSIQEDGYIYLTSSTADQILDTSYNNELSSSENISIKFSNNNYKSSEYILGFSYIVKESDSDNDINNWDYYNSKNNRLIGKTIYFKISLKNDLSEDCDNKKCLLCFEANYSCISYKPEINTIELNTEPKIEVSKKTQNNLDILYSLIIIFIPLFCFYLMAPSFQYLRIIFFMVQLIIFCILSFGSKYKKNYLWNNDNYKSIHTTPYPVILDLMLNSYGFIDIKREYQNYSIIETEEYSKECLNNYFIKKDEICPITDIEVKSNYSYKHINLGYDMIQLSDNKYIYYKKFTRFGKLYDNIFLEYYHYYYQSLFNSSFDYKNIDAIKFLEEMKLDNPFKNLKKFSKYSDALWIPLFIFSFMYYLIENKDDEKWNYFRIIDYSLQLIIFILFTVRYIFFVEVKNFYINYSDIIKNNLYIVNDINKYYFNYKLNIPMNAESFPIAIFITFISIFLFSLKVKPCCCFEYYHFSGDKYLFLNTNIKGRIYYLLVPILPIYFFVSIKDIVNDLKFMKNYDNIKHNWDTCPISLIEQTNLKNYEIGHLLTKESKYYFYSWKNTIFNVERMSTYSYLDLLTNTNGKICGKDNKGNDLYFNEDDECPINDIVINNRYFYKENYHIIKLGINNNMYLHYTNKKINGKIILDIRLGLPDVNLELNYEKSNELCIGFAHKTDEIDDCKSYFKFNTVPFYDIIDSWSIDKFIDNSYELSYSYSYYDEINEINLYSITYQGINSSLINETDLIINLHKNIQLYKGFWYIKIVFIPLSVIFFVIFLIFVNTQDLNLACFIISIIIFFLQLFYLIIAILSFNINKKYIQNFMNLINKDFEEHKHTKTLNLFLILFIAFYFISNALFIKFLFLFGRESLYKYDIKTIFNKIKQFFQNFFKKNENNDDDNNNANNSRNTSANNSHEENNPCCYCLTNPPKIIFAPCGHKCCCKECYDRNNHNVNNCPICRRPVQSVVEKVFKV